MECRENPTDNKSDTCLRTHRTGAGADAACPESDDGAHPQPQYALDEERTFHDDQYAR
jgi:hypothetical protein